MRRESRDYYTARERAERTAAEQAKCPEAQRAHQEMARAYAELAQNPELERTAGRDASGLPSF